MPTYNSAGVKATLSITDLRQTLGGQRPGTIVSKSKGKKDAQKFTETDRVAALFTDNGMELDETPIAAVGSKTRVVQFIGEYEDMPLVMVEAGQHLGDQKMRVDGEPILDPSLQMPGLKAAVDVAAALQDGGEASSRAFVQRDSIQETSAPAQQTTASKHAPPEDEQNTARVFVQRDSMGDNSEQPQQPTAPAFAQRAPSNLMPFALAPKKDARQSVAASASVEETAPQPQSIGESLMMMSNGATAALGASPQDTSATKFLHSTSQMPLNGQFQAGSLLDTPSKATGMAPQPSLGFLQAQTHQELQAESSTQALMLTVVLKYASFLPDIFTKPGKSGPTNNESLCDLRTEVFMNGQLVGWDYQNPRRGVVSPKQDITLRFLGTRFDTSTEKPWVYRSSDTVDQSPMSAQERWTSIAKLLREEVKDRGQDEWGVRPPSADYLDALSAMPLPERFANKSNLGIIDVIVTVGNGRKYASTSSYITSPKRMESSKFRYGPHPKEPSPGVVTPAQDALPSDGPEILSSSDTPLAQRARGSRRNPSSSFASGEVGEDSKPKALNVIETPKIRNLVSWFNLKAGQRQFLAEVLAQERGGELWEKLEPMSKLPPVERDPAIFNLIEELMKGHTRTPSQNPEVDLAGDEPTSPVQEENAPSSALGSSAQATPVASTFDTPEQSTAKHKHSVPSVERYKPIDSRGRWASAVAGARTFVIPELCLQSSVGYAGGDIHRPAPWARPGEYDEQAFVVGMRFVVV